MRATARNQLLLPSMQYKGLRWVFLGFREGGVRCFVYILSLLCLPWMAFAVPLGQATGSPSYKFCLPWMAFAVPLENSRLGEEKVVQCVTQDSSHISWQIMPGIFALQAGDIDRAIEHFTRATELHPGSVTAYKMRGEAYWGKGDFDKAMADAEKAVELGRDNPEGYILRAGLRFEIGKLRGAIEDYAKALEMRPNYFAKNLKAACEAYAVLNKAATITLLENLLTRLEAKKKATLEKVAHNRSSEKAKAYLVKATEEAIEKLQAILKSLKQG